MKDGKLFGKINIIDLLVLLLAAAAVVAVALKLTGRLGPARTQTGTGIVYTVQVQSIEPIVADSIREYLDAAKTAGKPGDQLMANGELLDAYITDMEVTPHKEETSLTLSNGYAALTAANADKVDIVFTVEGNVANNTKTELGTQEVRIGKSHIVKTTHFELTYGVILTCQWANGTSADY